MQEQVGVAGRYYTTQEISVKQAETPEGFLLLYNVPLARTGEQLYYESELKGWNIQGDEQGVVIVTRLPEDVFDPEAVASFEAKPVANMHPFDGTLITPETYRRDAVGVVVNVRREGDLLVGDMLVQDAAAIEAVRAGRRQVSCGYTCDYVQLGPARARQYNIRGNHVALVDVGRCGDQCSIGDAMPKSLRTLKARMLSALSTKDEASLRRIVDEMPAEEEEEEQHSRAGEVHVHNHFGASEDGKLKTRDADKDDMDKDDDKEKRLKNLEDSVGKLAKTVSDLKPVLDAVAKKLAVRDEKEIEGVENPPAAEQVTDADEDKDEDKDENKDKDKESTTDARPRRSRAVADSAALVDEYDAVLADAEVLSPGLRVPSFDSAQPATVTRDMLCGVRRRALDAAYQTQEGHQVISQVLPREHRANPAFRSRTVMDCAAVSSIFSASVALMRRRNNDSQRGTAGYDPFACRTKPASLADLNKANRAHWGDR